MPPAHRCRRSPLLQPQRRQTLGDAMWDAWANVCGPGSSGASSHAERLIGVALGIGGLLFYSLLTSTMSAHFKARMEWLREGAHTPVMEEGHIVICGTNAHLPTLVRQLDRAHAASLAQSRSLQSRYTVLL
eukprot:SM004712S16640  [mRNA]  locus=s4712:5:827:- [translate_table: standard]